MFGFKFPKEYLIALTIALLIIAAVVAQISGVFKISSFPFGKTSQEKEILSKATNELLDRDAHTSLSQLEKLVAENPKNREATLLLASFYGSIATNATASPENQAILGRAKTLAERMLSENIADIEGLRLASAYNFAKGDFKTAVRALRKALDLAYSDNNLNNSSRSILAFQLGQAWQFVPDLDRAETYYQLALQLKPGSFAPAISVAQILQIKKDYDAAQKAYDALLKQDLLPDARAMTLLNKSLLLSEIGKFQEAKELAENSLKLNSKNFNTLFQLARVELFLMPGGKYNAGSVNKAQGYLNEAMKLNPYATNVNYLLALTYDLQGRKGEAYNSYKKSLDLIGPDRSLIPSVKTKMKEDLEKALKRVQVSQSMYPKILAAHNQQNTIFSLFEIAYAQEPFITACDQEPCGTEPAPGPTPTPASAPEPTYTFTTSDGRTASSPLPFVPCPDGNPFILAQPGAPCTIDGDACPVVKDGTPPPPKTCQELGTCPPPPGCEATGTCPKPPTPKTCAELGTCPLPPPPTCVELGTCPTPPPSTCEQRGDCPVVPPPVIPPIITPSPGGGGGGGLPPICSGGLSANPQNVNNPGDKSTLGWSCSPSSCAIDKKVGSGPWTFVSGVPNSGSKDVFPTSGTTYRLSCTNARGPSSYQTTVGVIKVQFQEVNPTSFFRSMFNFFGLAVVAL